MSVKYLQTEKETVVEARKHGKYVHVDDVVIDEMAELAWRLRALYATKNLRGTRS